jgi:hypothetical protein
LDLRDDTETAVAMFDLINMIVNVMITQPKEVSALYDKIPKGAKEAIRKEIRLCKSKYYKHMLNLRKIYFLKCVIFAFFLLFYVCFYLKGIPTAAAKLNDFYKMKVEVRVLDIDQKNPTPLLNC